MNERLRRFALRVRALAQKEVFHILRDPRSLYLGLGMPVMLLVLMGAGISFDLDRIPLDDQDVLGLFRRADTLWRSEASTQRADNTKFNNARQELNVLVRDVQREEEKDAVWVAVQESLGDSHWTPRNQRNWGAAWQYYSQVLEWWAGQRATPEARDRYLDIVWRTAKPPQAEPYYRYGNYGNVVPLNILENTLKIAVTDNDKADAHYLLAISFQYHGGDWDARARVPEHFEAALKPGKGTDW